MKATEILKEEHNVIWGVLDTIEAAAKKVESGEINPQFFIDAAGFIKGFADGCQHRKEEGMLFEAMHAHGVPVEGGPIGVMLHEHELGREYTRGMRSAAERWQQGDESVKAEVSNQALAYVQLLRQHISKEDNILFPMANKVIPLEEQDGVEQGFERVEHEETGEGIHEKYLALATDLAAQV